MNAAAGAITVQDLRQRYGEVQALDGVSFRVPKGTCFGILGPNGAGKTTLLEIIEGLRNKDSGHIEVLGLDLETHLESIQAAIGVQLQEANYIEFLSLEELLAFFLRMYRRPRSLVPELLGRVHLLEKLRENYSKLSGGQKQRFSIAVALVNDPEILFLDEPTTGLDPQNRQYVWDLVQEFKRAGKTVILTTHNMDEADKLADELVIIDRGRVIASGTPARLKANLKGENSVTLEFERPIGQSDIQSLTGCLECHSSEEQRGWRVLTKSMVPLMAAALELSASRQNPILHVAVQQVTLEDVFINLTGKGLRE